MTFEQDEAELWAHIWLEDGRPFGKAAALRALLPVGTWVSVPPAQQPGITWLLTHKVGFQHVAQLPIDGELHDVLQKVS